LARASPESENGFNVAAMATAWSAPIKPEFMSRQSSVSHRDPMLCAVGWWPIRKMELAHWMNKPAVPTVALAQFKQSDKGGLSC
jgi:hypothetical protein